MKQENPAGSENYIKRTKPKIINVGLEAKSANFVRTVGFGEPTPKASPKKPFFQSFSEPNPQVNSINGVEISSTNSTQTPPTSYSLPDARLSKTMFENAKTIDYPFKIFFPGSEGTHPTGNTSFSLTFQETTTEYFISRNNSMVSSLQGSNLPDPTQSSLGSVEEFNEVIFGPLGASNNESDD